jgi:type I restriction enzyme S subunit
VCQSNIFIDEVVARSNGVSYPAINASDIGDIRIPSPDNSIQRAIADYLDVETARIDAIISKKKQLMALAFERLEATLERIFSRWEQIPLRRLATRIDVGIAEAATHAYADDGVPLIRSTNIRRNRIDASDLLFIEPWFAERNRSKYVLVGDIVTVRTGEAGVSAVVPPELDQSQCFTQLITTLKPGYRPEIFCAALNCGDSRRYFRRSEWGSAQANISVPLLANAPVPNIPVSEQTAITLQISSLLRKADHIASSLKKQVELFQEHRQALVTAAVTGQLDLPEVAHGNH